RLWDNQDALKKALNRELNRAVVQGLNPRETAKKIRDQFGVSVSNSERLMRTEQARISADIFKDSAEQMDVKEYEYIAEPTACDECADLDGKIFKVKDMQPGTNAYPMHPNCMCSHGMHVDRDAYEKELEARGL